MHLIHHQRTPVLSGAAEPEPEPDSAARTRRSEVVHHLARGVYGIRMHHHDAQVTTQILRGAQEWATAHEVGPRDVLVAGIDGYLRAAGHATGADFGAPFPVVVVQGMPIGHQRPDIALVTTGRASRAASFAFDTAAAFGADVRAVRLVSPATAFGDDYWIDPADVAAQAAGRLRAELGGLRSRYPAVAWEATVSMSRPTDAVQGLTPSARLVVVSAAPEANPYLRALLSLAACPVAIVPEA